MTSLRTPLHDPGRHDPARPGSDRSAPAPPAPTVSRTQLLEAARLGAAVARADLTDRPGQAAPAYASWRQLRRRARRRSRQLLRVAFDTGYGRAMQTAGSTPG